MDRTTATEGTSGQADTLFVNGYVYTVDAVNSVASAIAVRDGRIVQVGDDESLLHLAGPNTCLIDLDGRMLMPGLIDAHLHPLAGGEFVRSCNLDYLPLTKAQFAERVRLWLEADGHDDRSVLQVQGWYRDYMQPAGTTIDRDDLDALSSDRPIIVTNRDHHTKVLNSAAIALLGIDEDTPDPPGGRIGRDGTGRLNGLFEDHAAIMLNDLLPPAPPGEDVLVAEIAANTLSHKGVTTLLDAMATPQTLGAFAALRDAGKLPIRFFAAGLLAGDEIGDPASAVAHLRSLKARYESPLRVDAGSIHIRSGKIFLDGVLQYPTQTAALLTPYLVNKGSASQPCWCAGQHKGDIYVDPAMLDKLVPAMADAGFDPHIHAIGDRAVRLSLDAISQARRTHPGDGYRPVIAHDELVESSDVPRFAELNVSPVMSFQWAVPGPNTVTGVKDYLGPERFAHMEPIATLDAAGARVAYGSDWPVDQLNYWKSLKAGIDRMGDARFGKDYGGTLNDEPGISRELALRAVTINAAWTLHLDEEVGSLEPGKLADLIVLDRNLMDIPLDDWPDTQVLLTMLGGRIVAGSPSLTPAVAACPPKTP